MKTETSDAATSGQATTLYRTASFDVACHNCQAGILDVQLASNRPHVVSYRLADSDDPPVTLRGTNPDQLVEQGIRALCSCGSSSIRWPPQKGISVRDFRLMIV